NKLLLPWQNKPIVAVTAANLLGAGFEEVIVVTGHQAAEVTAALNHLPLRLVHNPRFEEGMTSSIQTGISQAGGKGYMICLADMFLITPAEYILLKKAWEQEFSLDDHCIGIPEYQGQKGNPVILPCVLRSEILSHEEKEGCKEIVRNNSKHQLRISMPTDHILRDLDLPEEYIALTD
ncbi:MAG TPA: nucleotidyltransferase family protein, partial [Puia sp.]|nr:nucleotidyltransferase family protein [Puia sp.]